MRTDIKIADSMLDLVGSIPLVRLNRVGRESGAEILVKPEFLNPSGSIKDRIALRMIEKAEQEGRLRPEDTIIEATTGNTGTALAFVAAVKGYRFVAYSPAKVANRSRMAILQAYGCDLETVGADLEADDDRFGRDTAFDRAVHGGRVELVGRRVCLELEEHRGDVWWARQFSSPQNTGAHREWTAAEILASTDGRLDAFVASVGTGGTLLGVAQALKERDSSITVVAVEPAGGSVIGDREGYPVIPGVSDGIVVDIWKSNLVDRVVSVSDEEAIETAHRLAEQEGIFCGMSSGANVLACIRIAQELPRGARIVTVLPDSRDRYLEVERYTT